MYNSKALTKTQNLVSIITILIHSKNSLVLPPFSHLLSYFQSLAISDLFSIPIVLPFPRSHKSGSI